MTSHSDLAALPEPLQVQLIRIARLAAGMSTAEKGVARQVLGATAVQLAMFGDDDTVAAAEMLSALGVIVAQTDAYARPTETGDGSE